jgi:hypothetical protein
MKKSRIFMAAGALVLAISAMFATKANKKFGSGTKTAYGPTGDGITIVWGSTKIFTTVARSGFAQVGVELYTVVNNNLIAGYQLFTASGHPLFMLP